MRKHAYDRNVDHVRRGIVIAAATAPVWVPDLVNATEEESPMSSSTRRPNQDKIVMTIAYDNNPGATHLTTAWGFSCLIQGLDKTILFDTGGDGELLLRNMDQLGLDPKQVDAVVLSHIHWDHVGGLPSILQDRSALPVYTPSGFPPEFLQRARSLGAEVIQADESVDVCPHARTTGTLGKGAIEEHGLCVETQKGWVLITGCAHPGAENLTARAAKIVGQPMHLVVGGFHMLDQSEPAIHAAIDRFDELGVKRAAPCHCSGDTPRRLFKQRLAGRCSLVGAGDRFRFAALRAPANG